MRRTLTAGLAALLFFFLLAVQATAAPGEVSLAALMVGEFQPEAGTNTFRPNWRSLPDRTFKITKRDFQYYGGWGRLTQYNLSSFDYTSKEEEEQEWNPNKNLDAYTYGAFVIYHEQMLFAMPGVRMEFNNIDEHLILCLDIAGPGYFGIMNEGLEIGGALYSDTTTENHFALHAAFSAHIYLAGEIVGPYIGPVVGFNAFFLRKVGFQAFPLVGLDVGIRLNMGKLTFVCGVMGYGMVLKRVHPDYAIEGYAGLGFLI